MSAILLISATILTFTAPVSGSFPPPPAGHSVHSGMQGSAGPAAPPPPNAEKSDRQRLLDAGFSQQQTDDIITVQYHPRSIADYLYHYNHQPIVQIQYLLFNLKSNEELLAEKNVAINVQAYSDNVVAMSTQFYPLYTAYLFEHALYKRSKNKHMFRIIDPHHIYNFSPCLQENHLKFFERKQPLKDAMFTTMAAAGMANKDVPALFWRKVKSVLYGKQPGNLFHTLEFLSKEQKTGIENVEKHQIRPKDADIFLQTVADVFQVQIIILDARITNDDQYPHELIDAHRYKPKKTMIGTVYLFEALNFEYHAVIPVDQNYEYPVKKSCFSKTTVFKSQRTNPTKQALVDTRSDSPKLPPGVKKQPQIMQSLREKQKQAQLKSGSSSSPNRKSRNSKGSKSRSSNTKKPQQKGIFEDKNMKIILIVSGVSVFCLVAICAGLCLALRSRS